MWSLPSYDELVKWRWGVPTWRLRYKILGILLILILVGFSVGPALGLLPLKKPVGTLGKSIDIERSVIGGDVVQGDKNVVATEHNSPEQNPLTARRKIKITISRNLEDGWTEIQRLFEETNSLKEQITNQHAVRGTVSSGLFIRDQADRVKAFNQNCDKVLQRVDRTIEDALVEQEAGIFEVADWLADERKLYESLTAFIAKAQNQVFQDGQELAKRFGDEALWTNLMNK